MNKYDGIDEKIVLNVKIYARRLKKRMNFNSVEIDDLEQDLMCEILSCIDKFDKNYGNLDHFIRKVLNRRSTNLLKSYICKKRHLMFPISEYNDEVQNSVTNDLLYRYNYSLEKKVDYSNLIEKLPAKYKLLYKLMADGYSSVEISKITDISRTTVSRKLKELLYMLHYLNDDSKKLFCFIVHLGEKMKEIREVERLSVKELSELPVYDLSDLNEQVLKLIVHTKEIKEKFEDALNLRFSEVVRNNLRSENRDTGTTKFIENGFQIIAEVPKKVTWDSEKIDVIIKNISEVKRKNIIKTTHVIDERKYQQLTPEDQLIFADARTVTPGKTKFKITIPNSEEV